MVLLPTKLSFGELAEALGISHPTPSPPATPDDQPESAANHDSATVAAADGGFDEMSDFADPSTPPLNEAPASELKPEGVHALSSGCSSDVPSLPDTPPLGDTPDEEMENSLNHALACVRRRLHLERELKLVERAERLAVDRINQIEVEARRRPVKGRESSGAHRPLAPISSTPTDAVNVPWRELSTLTLVNYSLTRSACQMLIERGYPTLGSLDDLEANPDTSLLAVRGIGPLRGQKIRDALGRFRRANPEPKPESAISDAADLTDWGAFFDKPPPPGETQ